MDIGLGSIVFSKAGRDQGEYYVVIALEGEYAYICDGKTRKCDKPKKKKFKHMAVTKTVSSLVKEKIEETGKVTNSEIRRAISDFREQEQ